METLTKLVPFLTKLFALITGGIIALVLSGDINLDSNSDVQLKINFKVILKLACSIGAGLFLGEFTIDFWDFEHLDYYAQAVFYLLFSAFGMLAFGIVYRSLQLTLADKTLSEIVAEIKSVIKELVK